MRTVVAPPEAEVSALLWKLTVHVRRVVIRAGCQHGVGHSSPGKKNTTLTFLPHHSHQTCFNSFMSLQRVLFISRKLSALNLATPLAELAQVSFSHCRLLSTTSPHSKTHLLSLFFTPALLEIFVFNFTASVPY